MAICQQCGADAQPDDVHCRACGARIKPLVTPPDATREAPPEASPPPSAWGGGDGTPPPPPPGPVSAPAPGDTIPPPPPASAPGWGAPGYGGSQWSGAYSAFPKVPNYLGWAIGTLILCCLPAGIVAVVYASQANSAAAAGRYDDAMRAAKNARTWIIVSVAVGIVAGVVWFAVGAASMSTTTTGY